MMQREMYSSQQRSHNFMPIALDSPTNFAENKQLGTLALWKKILTRERKPYRDEKRMNEWSNEDERQIVKETLGEEESTRFVLALLRKYRGEHYNGFKTHLYQAIKMDRPDLIMYSKKGVLGHQEWGFVARSLLAQGKEERAREYAQKLSTFKGRNAWGYLGVLVALRDFKTLDKILYHLEQDRVGLRAQFFDLLNSPFESELNAMLEFADHTTSMALKKVFRMQVVRAYLHKHQVDKAIEVWKKYNDFFRTTFVPTLGIATQNLRWALQTSQLKVLREHMRELASYSSAGSKTVDPKVAAKRKEIMELYRKNFVGCLMPVEALKIMGKFDAADPLVVEIWNEGSANWRRDYFEHIAYVFVNAFNRQGRIEELKTQIKTMSAASNLPKLMESLNLVRFHLVTEEYETAFTIYKDMEEDLKRQAGAMRIDMPMVKKLQRQLITKPGKPLATKIALYLKNTKHIKYPSLKQQRKGKELIKQEQKAKEHEALFKRAVELNVPGTTMPDSASQQQPQTV